MPVAAIAAWVALVSLGGSPAPHLDIEVSPVRARLIGSDSGLQLLVTGRTADLRTLVDLTHDPATRYRTLHPGVAKVAPGGFVRPCADGTATIEIRAGEQRRQLLITVEDYANRRGVDFAAEVAPILTKRGCNGGSCHGKAAGQNGFRLSLLGFDPAFDLERLVNDDRGRRIFPAAPGLSLLLRKPTAQLPHGGGRRFEIGSAEYRTIARWIAQGMTAASATRPVLTGLEIEPAHRRIRAGERQQLRVEAHFDDGTTADVTRLTQFQSSSKDLAEVDDHGRVQALDGVGTVAIMARFGGQFATSRVTMPLATDAPEWAVPSSTNLIDRLVFDRLRELGLPPSAPCTDAEFARRSSIDVCGVLPTPEDVAALERERSPEKRERWIERLLERPEYADLFATKWSAILKNKRALGEPSKAGSFAFHAWIRQSIAENKAYDRFVAEILTAKGEPGRNPPVVWYREVNTLEERVDDTAQLFLGVRMQCARCHHHPYDRWSPDDYYGFASLFSRIGRKPGSGPGSPRLFVLPEGLARDPVNRRAFPPRVLGGKALEELAPRRDPRQELVGWLRDPENPFFARTLVNRYWKHFFGQGLVEPEDDIRSTNPPSNPELLAALANDFVAHGYDLKRLVRLIATSRTYERSSLPNDRNQRDRQNFARFYPRRLPAEVLLDAIGTVTGVPTTFAGVPKAFRAVQLPDEAIDTPDGFLQVFGRPKRESVCECERSGEANLVQSLDLWNSAALQRALEDPKGRASRWALENDRPDSEKIDELYRLAYARLPTADEREVCLGHLVRRRAEGKAQQGFEDLIWALINTKEFLFNR